MSYAQILGESWDDGYAVAVNEREYNPDRHVDPELQRCYQQGYEFGRSWVLNRDAVGLTRRDDMRVFEYALSDHDLYVLKDALYELADRDDYPETGHCLDLIRYLFED